MSLQQPKITGIGGVFFKTKDPEATRNWYQKHLGIDVSPWGATFVQDPEKTDKTQWSPFPHDSTYFEPSTKEFMINYRVQNIEGLVAQLKADGVALLDEITSHEYGKFVHLLDLDGTKLELWEPA